ncbi:MAG: hypothetical protein ACP5OA_01400 [Candidatus Woesearchaeota archaeon]
MSKNFLSIIIIILLSIFFGIIILPDVSAGCVGNPSLHCYDVKIKEMCSFFSPLCIWTGLNCFNAPGKSCSDATESQCSTVIHCTSDVPTCDSGVCCDRGYIADKNFVCAKLAINWRCSGQKIYKSFISQHCSGNDYSKCDGLIFSDSPVLVDACTTNYGEPYGCIERMNITDNLSISGDDSGLSCESFSELRCFDGIDNDNDGVMDCADNDCINSLVSDAPYHSFKCTDNDIWYYTRCGTRTDLMTDCGVYSCVNGSTMCNAVRCGDYPYTIEPGETCDGYNLNNQSCETLGMVSGTLRCAANCTAYETYGCCPAPAITICGTGACERNITRTCIDGVYDECIPGKPSTERCNGIDDDCDGVIDEDCSASGKKGFFYSILRWLGFRK